MIGKPTIQADWLIGLDCLILFSNEKLLFVTGRKALETLPF